MFNVSKVRTALRGLVGWEQPIDPKYAIVDFTNQTATSGRYFTDNQFVKISFLKDTQDYSAITDNDFNSFLLNVTDRAITDVLDKVFSEPDFVDRQLLYKYANNKVATDTLPDGFVGYEIKPSITNNNAFEIKRVLLEFANLVGNIELLLYNSSISTPIFSEVVTVDSNPKEVVLNWVLDNSSNFYGGEYFFGYRTNGVTIQPIKRDYEFSEIASNITGLNIQAIYSPQSNSSLFDLEDVENVEETWGLNPDFVVYKDYTDFIIQNQRLFAPAIQTMGQIKAMETYIASSRSNRNERISNDHMKNVLIELDGINTESYGKTGLRTALSTQLTDVKREVNKLIKGLFDYHSIISVTRS